MSIRPALRRLFWLFCMTSSAAAARADVLTVGSQAGAQIFFNSTLTRIYNFGVTQTGAQSGLTLNSIDVNVKGANAQSTISPVIVSIYSGLGGTGSILRSGTIAASSLSTSFDFLNVAISPITLSSGGYSVVLTTTNADNYYIKNGSTKLTTNGTASVTTSYWVQDTNTEGTAGTTLNAAEPVLATWTLGTNAMAFGNYRVGATLSSTTAIVNTALVTSNTQTQALAVTGTTSGGVSSLAGLPSPYLAVGGTSNLVAALNGATTGPNSGTASLSFSSVPGTSNTSGTTAVGSGQISLTGTGYNWANAAYTGTAVAFGYIHRGAAAVSGSVAFGNEALASASYQDSLNVTGSTGNALVTATGFTGLAASSGGTTRDNLVVAAATGTAGSLNSTVGLSLVSNANGVAGLSNGTATVAGSPGSITTTGTVYTGQSTWATNGGGQWGTLASNFGTNWNWGTFDGSPGVAAGFADTDTANFGNAVTSGTATVSITAATPSVRSVTFSNNAASYVVAGVSGGSLALRNSGTNAAAVNVTAGSHTISAAVALDSRATMDVASGSRLTMSGAIEGTSGITKTGGGFLSITGNNTYAGVTTVTAGTLSVNGSIATSDLTTVQAGATLAGSGVVGDTVVYGVHAPGNSPGVQTTGTLTYQSGASLAWELIANSISDRGTNYDGVNVNGPLTFAGATSLLLSFNGAGSSVDWNDSFWSTSHLGTGGWLVYSGADSLTGFSNLSIGGVNWADGFGNMLSSIRPNGTFSTYQSGNDIYLNYAIEDGPGPGPEPVPEIDPAGLGSVAALVMGALGLIERRRRKPSSP